MAFAALVSLEQIISQILNHDRYSISLHKKQLVISIQEYAVFLKAFLEHFPEKANSLEGLIRNIANEAEDSIEFFMWEHIQMHSGSIKSSLGPARGKFKHQLEDLIEKIESVAEQATGIKNSATVKEVQHGDGSPTASSSSSPPKVAPTHKKLVGFDDDLMEIKTRLCGELSTLQVIPIVGMGGIGKTTLARNVFDDELTVEHFQIRVWATVSQDYTAQEIISTLLDSTEEFEPERPKQSNKSMDVVFVYKRLMLRRYLIVLDDMWSTKAWDDVWRIFPDNNNGSRVMLTTRLSDVAAYPDSSSILHEMRVMDEHQSWNLLKEKVFENQEESCLNELEDIGKEIARSCRGLPLTIVVIAGVLSSVSRTRASWGEIAENVKSEVVANDGLVERILSLSYRHLPHHLRPCFLYMGCFPEDHEIRVSNLIKLWIAEGFLEFPNGSKSFEEAAEEYLEDLVKRSLVLVTKRKSINGKIKSCSVHDLVRDLCIRKSEEEKFLIHARDGHVLPESIKSQRRVSIADSDLVCLKYMSGSSIRTIISIKTRGNSVVPLENLRLLRVLDMARKDARLLESQLCDSISDQVFKMFHLRYLAFNHPIEIPVSIIYFQNLQTLIVRRGLACLPSEIWKLPQLRHILLFFSIEDFPYPQNPTFILKNLHTLSLARNFMCKEEVLNVIPNLKKLGLFFNIDQNYYLENLVHLHQLESLKLKTFEGCSFWPKLNHVFPSTLKKLTLWNWRFPWEDMKIFGSLPNLEVLKLRVPDFQGGKWETAEGQFPQLKFLLIQRADPEHWITESSHFPSLKCLLLHSCWHLREIPEGIGEILTLELIEVKDSLSSLEDSARRIEEEQQSDGNYALQVRCINYRDAR